MNNFSFKRPQLAVAYCDSLSGQGIANYRSGLFLAGPRRVGKSTFLTNELIPEALNRDWIPIYVDLWANKNLDPAILIADAIKTVIARYQGKIHKLAKTLKLNKINILGTVTLDLAKSGLPDNMTLADALLLLTQLAEQPIMVVIDEAQHALTTKDGLNAMFAIKSARDQINTDPNTTNLMLVFTGSNRDKLGHLVLKKDQPFFGCEITTFPLLNKEYSDLFTQWINRNLAGENQFSCNSMWQAFQLVGHRPEILRQLAAQVALSGEADHFTALLEKNAFLWQNRIWEEFENDFLALSPLQRAILTTMIQTGKTWSPFSEEAIKRYKLITGQEHLTVTSVQAAIYYLRDHSFIWQSGRGSYALEDESFAIWFHHYQADSGTSGMT